MTNGGDPSFSFVHTKRVQFGTNIVSELGNTIGEMDLNRAVVVTDRFLAEETDLLERVKKGLGKRFVGAYTGVVADSIAPSIDQGAQYALNQNADLLISLGGGSAIDTAKGVAVVLTEGGQVLDHEGYHTLERPLLPHVAIPTTAGTGSEMTMVTVIKDPSRGQKTFIGSYYLHPCVAVLDPTLTTGLSPKLTAGTGMDAMSHAVECLISTLNQPFSNAYALEAIHLIITYLPRCLQDPMDLKARGKMLIAANMAGSAFSNAMVSLNHAIAHALGARYEIHHGTANAMLLPHSMRFFNGVAGQALARAARAMGLSTSGLNDEQAGNLAADTMEQFTRDLGLIDRLRDYQIDEDQLGEAAEMAMADGAILNSPKPDIELDDIIEILRKAW